MFHLPAGQSALHIAGYALLAVLVTTGLFTAERAYRAYQGKAVTEASVPAPAKQAAKVPAAMPQQTESAAPPAPALTEAPKPETLGAERSFAEKPAETRGFQTPILEPSFRPVTPTNPAASAPSLASTPSQELAPSVAHTDTDNDDARELRKERANPRVVREARPRQARQLPSKQARRERAASRSAARAEKKPAKQAARPGVYWERDSQLGFASPQLRQRICNPAAGQMPMQCYYPREGRDRFPVKPAN